MPRYEYRCNECDKSFMAFHGMNEVLDKCRECEADGAIFRVPSAFSLHNSGNNLQKPGEVVKEFIKSAKQDILEHKKDLTKDYKVEH